MAPKSGREVKNRSYPLPVEPGTDQIKDRNMNSKSFWFPLIVASTVFQKSLS